ncbi:hypothetical protein [Oscillochloris sp. ZM17-4]|nr:hypothetical protein [Oscillochloris sp. ZM17-4]
MLTTHHLEFTAVAAAPVELGAQAGHTTASPTIRKRMLKQVG